MITSAPTGNVVKMHSGATPTLPVTGPAPGLSVADPCTDLANAQRLRNAYADRLLFVDGIGWHVWQTPWKHDEHAAAEIAHELGKIVRDEAVALAEWVADATPKAYKGRETAMLARFRWARLSEQSARVTAALDMAKPYLLAHAEDMDADPDVLGCRNGVLDLARLQFRPYTPADRITKTLGTEFDPEAKGEAWRQFVTQIFGGDAELIDWVQRLIGYCLSGHRPEHMLPVFWGSGSNGKSTFLGALQAMFGDYADAAPETLLIQHYGSEHPTEIAGLQGQRFVVTSESSESGKLNEERVKAITGGDKITARRMRMDYFSFTPTHQLILQTNHKPVIRGTDDGIWRRLRLVPFVRTFKGADRDPDLPAKLKADLPGVLAWAVEGWKAYRERGLGDMPAIVADATSEYRRSSDVIGGFIAECCDVDRVWSVKGSDLYRAYTAWCEENGEHASSQRDLSLRLSERGFQKWKSAGSMHWRGLKITPMEEPTQY